MEEEGRSCMHWDKAGVGRQAWDKKESWGGVDELAGSLPGKARGGAGVEGIRTT